MNNKQECNHQWVEENTNCIYCGESRITETNMNNNWQEQFDNMYLEYAGNWIKNDNGFCKDAGSKDIKDFISALLEKQKQQYKKDFIDWFKNGTSNIEDVIEEIFKDN